jgi:hypothetical protein
MARPTPPTDSIGFCKAKIDRYKDDARLHCIAFFTSQIAAVFLSGITPILIILQVPDSIKAAAPALASIAGGLSVYRWKENWIRCESTSEKLQAELLKFNSVEVEEKDKTTATQKFLTKILEINDAHLKQWRTENEVDPENKELSSLEIVKDEKNT